MSRELSEWFPVHASGGVIQALRFLEKIIPFLILFHLFCLNS